MINIQNLSKCYDNNLVAVDNVSVDIGENEVFGLLGPNGAGKTTLIHMLATLLRPTSGTAYVNGFDIVKNAKDVRKNIGIVFQAPSSDDMLSGYENLKIHSFLYNVPSAIREKRILQVLELVGLTKRRNDLVKKYSGGMRRRLEIARGLLHKPKVIFLDEPTLGLDPTSRESMWDYIQNLVKEEKITVILTTHYMEEAEKLCNRIGFINKGRLIALDTPTKLKDLVGGDIIKLQLKKQIADNIKQTDDDGFSKKKTIDFLKGLSFVKNFEIVSSDTIIVRVDNINTNLPILLKWLDVVNVELSKSSLNDVFKIFTKGNNISEDPEGGFMERYAQYD